MPINDHITPHYVNLDLIEFPNIVKYTPASHYTTT